MATSVELRPLYASADLPAATALLAESLPHDGIAHVAAEKLFGDNGRRAVHTVGAFAGDELLGVLAQAGRWIKLLAVRKDARRRGIGTELLAEARQHLKKAAEGNPAHARLRVGDHPGNYLSPGLDPRYFEALAFLAARGFREVARILNVRAPVHENPLLSDARLDELTRHAVAQGYKVRRTTAADCAPLLAFVETAFSATWALEVARALGTELGGAAAAHTPTLPEGPGVHAAWDGHGAPVAFAAHDGNNRGLGWFGPTGTLPAHRGRKLGELLLIHCLRDVAARLEGGVIPWVGPVDFYARASGARPDREFLVYEEI